MGTHPDTDRIERYQGAYSGSLSFESVLVRHRQDLILERLRRYQPATVVEVGCGLDSLFSRVQRDSVLSNALDRWVTVEPVGAFLSEAEKGGRGDDRLVLIQGTVEDVGREVSALLGEADFLICASLLHELTQPHRVLLAMTGLAGTDSVLHLSVPNAYSLHRRLAQAMGLIDDEHDLSERNRLLEQRRVFDRESFGALVEGAGLEVVAEGGIFMKPFTHDQMSTLPFGDERLFHGLAQLGRELPELASELWVDTRKRL